ncbi:type VII secretion system-associated protein [Umezawaea beigongshangensis]|uniref:type VII secretion system-associated protein n=1 Tax=Umezawaea beigongshangensis TaxID=2780383 RepID=UPI0027DC5BBD|nr:type VII secretion system-associated protein [Umezawaea beigongshangensis]
MTNGTAGTGAYENYFLLMDPQWRPAEGSQVPDLKSIVGLWPLDDDGGMGRFRSNPDYEPIDENSPTDPVDAGLRLMLRDELAPEQLQVLLRDVLVEVAVDGDGRAVFAKSPDDVACVIVATAERHRARVALENWDRVGVETLAGLLPEGVDVLFNPGGPASVRLVGDFVRKAAELTPAEVSSAQAVNEDERLLVLPWDVPADGEQQRDR